MAAAARLYDKILILHRGPEAPGAAELELDLTEILAALEKPGPATVWLVVLEGAFDVAALAAVRAFWGKADLLAKNAKARLLIVSPSVQEAFAPTLTDALDALDSVESLKLLELFAREHDLGVAKAELQKAQARVAALLGIPAEADAIGALARFRENAERVRNLHVTLAREILALQKQKGAKAPGAPKAPDTPAARDKVAELKRAALAFLKSNGITG